MEDSIIKLLDKVIAQNDSILNNNGFWSVLGVVIGIIMSFFIKSITAFLKKNEIKRLLLDEMIYNKCIMENYFENIEKIKNTINGIGSDPKDAYNYSKNVYDNYFTKILNCFSFKEKDNIRYIYNILDMTYKYLEESEKYQESTQSHMELAERVESKLKEALSYTEDVINKKAKNIFDRKSI